jgi:hypothetical protein
MTTQVRRPCVVLAEDHVDSRRALTVLLTAMAACACLFDRRVQILDGPHARRKGTVRLDEVKFARPVGARSRIVQRTDCPFCLPAAPLWPVSARLFGFSGRRVPGWGRAS